MKSHLCLAIILCMLPGAKSLAQIDELYGITPGGGLNNDGTIFKTDTNGNNHEIIFNFDNTDPGKSPWGGLLLADDGMYYGLTYLGGANGYGTLFQYNPITRMYFNKFNFDNWIYGKYPVGGLIQGSNGKLYGMAEQGGASGFNGVIFEYDPVSEVMTKLHDFDGANTGSNPRGNLLQASNGKLYGMTCYGGINNKGVLFEYDIDSDVFLKKVDFNGTFMGNGSNPYGALIQATNELLYGMTNAGTIFSYDISLSQLTTLFYKTSTSGNQPEGNLLQADNGKLYGLMMTEGANNAGTIFEFDITLNAFTKLADFTPVVTGENPRGTLIQGSDGKLYGMTQSGGSSDYGVIFEYDITGLALNPVHEFIDYDAGRVPLRGTLIEQSPGLLVGMVSQGGLADYGAIFEFNTSTSNYLKTIDINTKNGYTPKQSILFTSDEYIYGVTYFGGSFNQGVIFSYDPGTTTFINKVSFDGATLGSNPKGSLIQASNGKIYGTTYNGGSNNLGVIFEYDPITDTLINKFDFDGALNGQNPSTALLEAPNGKLYGVTPQGGTNNEGVLFEYDPLTDTYVNKLNFDGASLGGTPNGGLFLASNGKIYGLTHAGGSFGVGILFEYDYLLNTFSPLVQFETTTKGSHPAGELIEATNGKLYGVARMGGLNNDGTLFEYDPTLAVFNKLHDFSASLYGDDPQAKLCQSSNGKLYGMTYWGGTSNLGVLFEYDILTDLMIKKMDFTGVANGSYPEGGLTQIAVCIPEYQINESVVVCSGNSYTFPDGYTEYNITADMSHTSYLQTINTCDSTIITSVVAVNLNDIVIQNLTSLSSPEVGTTFQWLDCDDNYSPILGETFSLFEAPTTGNFAVRFEKTGCIDTSSCITISNQNFYDTPGYTALIGEVFAFPVSTIDTCDAIAYGFPEGGIAPYSFDWFTQPNNLNNSISDSLCEGFHTLKIIDNIGDSILVNYYVTDTANYFNWYDTTFTGFADTIYINASNCALDYSLPLDSAYISQFYYLSPDTIPPGDLYFIEISYYQSGNLFLHQDTISVDLSGGYLINFNVYCPIKSFNKIKTILIDFNYPSILGNIQNQITTPVLFPNPTSGNLTINGLPENAQISVYNITGQLITDVLVKSNTVNFDYAELPLGIYFVHVQSESYSGTIKFVKQ